MATSKGATTANVRMRSGPGIEFQTTAFLTPKTAVEVLGTQGDWLKVKANAREGFVHRSFVMLEDQGVSDGFLREKTELDRPATTPAGGGQTTTTTPVGGTQPATTITKITTTAPADLANVPLEASADQRLPVNPKDPLLNRLAADIWNRFGNLLSVLANELKIDPAVAIAVFAVESGGRGFGPDGRMIIRFENQIFWDKWGSKQPDIYNQHFAFNPQQRWLDHKWRPTAGEPWRPTDRADFHGNQGREWEVLTFARSLNDTAAKLSISMGSPQIMGFNFATLGFESVHQMFDAFALNDRNQIIGFFDFVQGPSSNSRRVLALQQQDFTAFASQYNGPGQAAKYGSLIKTTFDAFHKMRGTTPA